jgi:Na+/melibiose symporter-like transporter
MYTYFSQKAAEYNEYDAINATLDEYDKRKPGLLVWGIILFVIGFIMLISFAESRDMAQYIIVLIIWCLGSVGMILAFIFGTIARKRNKEAALTRLVELADELHTHFVNFGYCSVGEEYTNPAILQAISENLRTGRATNIMDSINIMFDDAHKSQMEWAAMETAHSARQAAAGATAGAVFAAANFFLR